MIEAIFCDFNGVIIDDEPLQMAAYQEVLSGHGIELSAADYYGALGMDDKTFVRAAFARAQKELSDDVLQVVLAEKAVRHRKFFEHALPLFPGVETFLRASARNFSLGLVSMAARPEIDYVLARARLGGLFKVIVSAADVSVCKPAPDCYRIALEQLNDLRRTQRLLPLLPHECLAIEDSPPGIEAGRAAGMRTLGLTNTVSAHQLRAAGAEVVSANLTDWTSDAIRLVYGSAERGE
jgi:HAD superfamily hydrolase (TIGR01509 family)